MRKRLRLARSVPLRIASHPATNVVLVGQPQLRGGFVRRRYRVTAGGKALNLSTFAEPGASGRWEQFIVTPG